jgi:D-tyrosyl-tRNA(Tyr) deacylase
VRAVVQRVKQAFVTVDEEEIGRTGLGFLILLGVGKGDGPADSAWLAEKIAGLRVFEDDQGKMNRGLMDVGGGALVVSQFTLWADCRKGRRPSFIDAAGPDQAQPLYLDFIRRLEALGVPTAAGRFGAMMHVHLINDGPVTLILESPKP